MVAAGTGDGAAMAASEPDSFTISASAGAGGSITPSGEVRVQGGDSQWFFVASDDCYTIDDVVVDGVSQGAVTSYAFTGVSAPHTIAAQFRLVPFPIDVVAGPGGTVSPSGTVWVDCGQSRTFTITPNACYAIENVLVDGSSVGPATSYTFVDVQRDHTLEAQFAARAFTVASSAGAGGSIHPAGNVLVGCEAAQSFTITPATCYAVQDVTVDGVSQGAVTSYTFTNTHADHTIHAAFALLTYPIAASAGAGGSITPAGTVSVTCGTNRSFDVAPDACHDIGDVVVDGVSRGPLATYTFQNVGAPHDIAATFSIKRYAVTASAGAGGSITPSGGAIVDCGQTASFEINPDACQAVSDVVVDGVSVGAVTTYAFTDVRANHSIAVSFAPASYAITTSAGVGGAILPGGTVTVACGGGQTFTIAADPCYAIADVQVDGQSVGPVTSHTFDGVVADHTLSATFSFVEDGPPILSGLGADPVVLWPPDHSMRGVTIDYAASDCSSVGCSLTVESNESATGTGDGDLAPDVEVIDAHFVRLRAERAANGGGRVYTVTVTCTDAQGHATANTVRVVSAHDIASPPSGTMAPSGTTLAFSGVFWDVPGTTHQATWTFDQIAVGGSVVEPSGLTNGSSATTFLFALPGVYNVRMSLSDSHGLTSYAETRGDLPAIVAIYDTTDGYAAGGGWYASPPGALTSSPGATGKMSFGFASSFFRNPNNPHDPKGELQFAFGQGGLEFRSSSITGVVISAARARLTGTGSIVGDPASYVFQLGVVDGQLAGGGGSDRIRLKITTPGSGAVVYDTQPGAADDAEPTTVVGAGSSIVLHYQGATPVSVGDRAMPRAFALAPAQPNPAHGMARIRYSLPVRSQVRLRLFDVSGRCVATLADGEEAAGEQTAALDAGSLAGGVYFCRFEARSPVGSTLLHAETRKLLVTR